MCFSPEKHAALKRKFECSSPVKVNKYNLKKNDKTGEEDYNGTNYLTLTKHTKVNAAELQVDRQDVAVDNGKQMQVGIINYVQQYLSCNKCHAKVMDSPKKIIKCSECGLAQLKSKCSSKIIASILIKTHKDTMSLNIFDNIIEELYTLYKEQDGDIDKLFTELTDDDVTEIL